LFALSGQLEVAYDHLAQSLRGLETSAWVHGYMAIFGRKIASGLTQELSEKNLVGASRTVTKGKRDQCLRSALHSIKLARSRDPHSDTYLHHYLLLLKDLEDAPENQGSSPSEEGQISPPSLATEHEALPMEEIQTFRTLNPTNPNGVRLAIQNGSQSSRVQEVLQTDPLSQIGFDYALQLTKCGRLCNRHFVRICCNRLDYCSNDCRVWEILAQCLDTDAENMLYRYKSDLDQHVSWWTSSPKHFALKHALTPTPTCQVVANLFRLKVVCAGLLGIDWRSQVGLEKLQS